MPAETQNAFSWDDLRVFLALFRAGTLSGAGARLGVNASTAGRRLDALESALGARLFDRTPDGVRPTRAAEQLHAHAELMEQAAHGLAHAVNGFEAAAEGTVRLTAPPAVAEDLIAPALKRLRARHPKIVVDLDASIPYADLARREADIAVRLARPTSGDLVASKLAEERSAIVASPKLVSSLGRLQSLGDAPWIGWDDALGHLPDARWVEKHVPRASILLRTNSVGALLRAADEGMGVLLLVRGHARVRGLAPVKLAKRLAASLAPTPETALWLATHRTLRHVPRVAAVWSFLVEETRRSGLGPHAVG